MTGMLRKIVAQTGLTEQESVFVRAIVSGRHRDDAAELAGFARESSYYLMQRPRVVAALHTEIQAELQRDAPNSLKVLRTIRDDETAPARTRADIGLKLLAMAGHGQDKTRSDIEKPLADMSAADLLAFVERNRAEIDRLEAELAARAKDVTHQTGAQAEPKPLTYLD